MLSWKDGAGLEWSCKSLWSCLSCVIRYWIVMQIFNCHADLTRPCRSWIVIKILNGHAWLEWSCHVVVILMTWNIQPVLFVVSWRILCALDTHWSCSMEATQSINTWNHFRKMMTCRSTFACWRMLVEALHIHMSALRCSMKSYENVVSVVNMCISWSRHDLPHLVQLLARRRLFCACNAKSLRSHSF